MSQLNTLKQRLRREASYATDWGAARSVVEVALAGACVVLAIMPILPAYAAQQAFFAVLIGVISGVGVVLIRAFARWPLPLLLVIAFAVYVVVGGAVVFGKDLAFGFVPSGSSMAAMLLGVVTSWKEALTLEPPLGSSDGVLVLPFLIAFVGGLLTALIVTWKRSWGATIGTYLVVAGVLIVAILWGTQETVFGTYLGIGLFFLLMLWASWRMGTWKLKRVVSFSIFLVAVITLSLVITPHITSTEPRFVLRSVVIPPFDPRDQVSPLSTYRSYVKDQRDEPLLKVTGLPSGTPVRVATLDAYDGVVWSVTSDGSRSGSGAFRRIGERIEKTKTGEPFEATIEILALQGVWTPTVGYLHSVEFTSATSKTDFRFNDATGAAVTIGGLDPGTTYTLTGVVPQQPDDEDLGDAGIGHIQLAPAGNIPEAVANQAITISREAPTVALVVRKFEQFLSLNGFFSHGEAAGGYPSLSGHGATRMADLFATDIMVGDAEQYASAMALLARSQGIPARVVMGFIPQEDADEQVFTGSDMTAWVEVYYDDFGWVSYYPTPPANQTPTVSEEVVEPEPEPEAIQLPPDPAPQVTPPAVNTEDTDVAADDDPLEQRTDWALIARQVALIGIPLIVVIAGPLIILAIKVRRRRNRMKAPGAAGVVGGWEELVDRAWDLGVRPDTQFTRRETARFIEAGAHNVVVRPLADLADKAHFGLPDETGETRSLKGVEHAEYWANIDKAVTGLTASVPRTRRWKSMVSVSSLREAKRRAARNDYAENSTQSRS